MWHGALSNECKWNLSWDWKTQCIVLHNLPFPSQQHSHNHKSFMTKISDLSFSDSFCSLFLGTVFYLFSRGCLEFKLLLLFMYSAVRVPNDRGAKFQLGICETFSFQPLENTCFGLSKARKLSALMKWHGLGWSGQKSFQHLSHFFVATMWHKLQSYWW